MCLYEILKVTHANRRDYMSVCARVCVRGWVCAVCLLAVGWVLFAVGYLSVGCGSLHVCGRVGESVCGHFDVVLAGPLEQRFLVAVDAEREVGALDDVPPVAPPQHPLATLQTTLLTPRPTARPTESRRTGAKGTQPRAQGSGNPATSEPTHGTTSLCNCRVGKRGAATRLLDKARRASS